MSMTPAKVHAFLSQYCKVKPLQAGLVSELNETQEQTHYLIPNKDNLGILVFHSKYDIICYVTCKVNGKWKFIGDVLPGKLKFRSAFRTDYGIYERKPGDFMPWIGKVLQATK